MKATAFTGPKRRAQIPEPLQGRSFPQSDEEPLKNYNGIDYIEVSREDIQQATELASELLGISLDDISLPARNLLLLLLELPPDLHPQRSDESHRLDQDPPPYSPHRTNRNGTGPSRIYEEESAPNLQTPIQR